MLALAFPHAPLPPLRYIRSLLLAARFGRGGADSPSPSVGRGARGWGLPGEISVQFLDDKGRYYAHCSTL